MAKKKRNFVPSIMPCTEEQFKQLKPHLENRGIMIASIVDFKDCDHIINDFLFTDGLVTNIHSIVCTANTHVLIPTFNIEKFLENTNI